MRENEVYSGTTLFYLLHIFLLAMPAPTYCTVCLFVFGAAVCATRTMPVAACFTPVAGCALAACLLAASFLPHTA